jgi:hypothetical protein
VLGLFEEEDRGGLSCEYHPVRNVLFNLMRNDMTEHHHREHHELVDDKCQQVLKQLRRMGIFKKEDIRNLELISKKIKG